MALATVTELPDQGATEGAPTPRHQAVVEEEIGVLSAQIHMLNAELVERLVELTSHNCVLGSGVRTLGQWLSIHAKFAMPEARRIASVVQKVDSVPTLFEQAKRGRVSVGVLLNASRVSNSENEKRVAEVALRCTPNQSAKIFAKYRDVEPSASPDAAPDPSNADSPSGDSPTGDAATPPPDDQHEFWWRTWQDRKGRGRIDASLDSVTMALMEQAWRAARAAGERNVPSGADDGHGPGESDRYDGRPPRLGANEIASRLASTMIDAAHNNGLRAPNGEKFRVQVNVDVETLAKILGINLNPTGVFRLGSECFLTSTGRHLSDAEAARVLCDAGIQVLITHKGIPMWLGNEHRTFSRHQRRAMASRSDGRGSCEFPGCDQTHFLEAHHDVEHNDMGETTLDNGILLCGYHHRELHRNHWRVTTDDLQTFTFWEGTTCLGSTTRADRPGGRPPDSRCKARVNSPPKPPDWINGDTPKSDTRGEPLTNYAFGIFLDMLMAA